MSIIDYLQQWTANKKGERFLKTKLLGKNGKELSAIEPNTYSERFINVLTKRIVTVCHTQKHMKGDGDDDDIDDMEKAQFLKPVKKRKGVTFGNESELQQQEEREQVGPTSLNASGNVDEEELANLRRQSNPTSINNDE